MHCAFFFFFQVFSPSCSFLISILRLEEIKNKWASLGAQMIKNLPAMQETRVHTLCQEDPLERGNGNPFQYSCLEKSMDRGAWRSQRVRDD